MLRQSRNGDAHPYPSRVGRSVASVRGQKKIDRELDAKLKPYLQGRPLVVVISGLSGVGKDAVLDGIEERGHPFHRVVTVTTRAPRADEQNGVHYHFVSEDEYREMVDAGELLEHAEVYGRLYGVPEQEIREPLSRGQDVFLRTDVQGAEAIKEKMPEVVLIFLVAASMEELRKRLISRGRDSPQEIEKRLRDVPEEIARLPRFDYVVVNRDSRLDETVEQVIDIISAEKRRTSRLRNRI